jgi:hypothetical protein
MIKDHIQEQKGGDSSTNLQGQSIVVYQGITYADAKEIALDIYKSNFLKLSEEAADVAKARAEELTDKFLKELKEKNEQAIETLKDPGMQIALYSAQKEYARTGDKDLQDLLVDILIQRASQKERDIKQIVLDESLNVAPKLTFEQFDTLTLSWVITKTRHSGLVDLESLVNYFERFLEPFIDSLTENSSCYEHLQYVGCGSVIHLGGWGSIENKFRSNYAGLFCKGITEEDVQQEIENVEDVKPLLGPCLHNQTLIQIAVMDLDILKQQVQRYGVDESYIPKLNNLFEKSRMSESEVREYMLNARPKLGKLFSIWEKTAISRFALTTVGYAIAQANLRRRSGETVDMSIWIK